ncbi:uncharacterized protein LOC128868824 [Anastrepha ludens]|uniref:uncharacterized protein LOC128868824 n=1 Tax=Anastrepha ludens TaxID=28586 RepID=UPI0023AED52B|nr:uncharacterized protein LOC128868824 [Anastrepha ludens]
MEELSEQEFARLTAVERSAYLAALLGDKSGPESSTSDSEDEEWFLLAREESQRLTEISDSEEIPGDRDSEVQQEEYDDETTEVDTSHESAPDFLVAKDGTRWKKHQLPINVKLQLQI